MAIKLTKPKPLQPAPLPLDVSKLSKTAAKLYELVNEHAAYPYDGFMWLQCQYAGLAEHLGVNEKTIRRIVAKPPFRHRVRNAEVGDEGKKRHVLLRIGTELCETDKVFMLRRTWVHGLIYHNADFIPRETFRVMQLKAQGADKALYDRRLQRIKAAEKRAALAEKLKAGEKVSHTVRPHEMGLLREAVKTFGADASSVLACLTTYEGWLTFAAILKVEGLNAKYYDWPILGKIVGHPNIALQVYLDSLQQNAKIDISESARLLAKIEALTPKPTD